MSWAMQAGKKITGFFKGASVILTHLADPAMRYGTIYLMLATAIPAVKYEPAYQGCIGIIIAAPEFVLLGAFSVAEHAWKDGHKKWGGLLFFVCFLLTVIMIVTFLDIFIVKFNGDAINILNFCRCLVAFGFSVCMGKLDEESEQPTALQMTHAPAPSVLENLQAEIMALKKQINMTPNVLHRSTNQATNVSTSDLRCDNEQTVLRQQATDAGSASELVATTENVSRQTQQDPEVDKLALTLEYLTVHPEIANSSDGDEHLASYLGLQRAASARFWRIKALEAETKTVALEQNTLDDIQQEGVTTNWQKNDTQPNGIATQDDSTRQPGVNNATSDNDTKARVIAYATEHPNVTRQEIADACHVSLRTVQRYMKLVDQTVDTSHPQLYAVK